MPVTWEIQDSILAVTLVGDYGFNDPAAAILEGMADPRFQVGTSLLIDAQQSKSKRSSEDFRERALWMASLQAKGLSSRCAIVINGRPHQLGMARMAATHLDLRGMELEIFTDRREAVCWLSNRRTHAANAAGQW